jgi:hypothetical protein
MGQRTQSEPNLVNTGLDYTYAEPTRYEDSKRRARERDQTLKRKEFINSRPTTHEIS